MDRRAVFFAIASAVCLALTPAIPVEEGKPNITWIGWATTIAFAVLALASWLDHRSRTRRS